MRTYGTSEVVLARKIREDATHLLVEIAKSNDEPIQMMPGEVPEFYTMIFVEGKPWENYLSAE